MKSEGQFVTAHYLGANIWTVQVYFQWLTVRIWKQICKGIAELVGD